MKGKMETKYCNKCKTEKELTCFGKHRLHSDGLQSICKICKKQTDKIYSSIHKKEILLKAKDWYLLHKEERKEYMKKYNRINLSEIALNQHQKYLKNKSKNRIWSKDYVRNRCKTDICYRLKRYLSNRIYYALKDISKSESTMKLVDCSIEFLKSFLESKFTVGMSWDNYGKWHVDHIQPCITFDLSKPSEQLKCFNYTNLQPLWAKDNLRKGSKR